MVRKVRLPSVGFVLLDKGELASVALYKAVLVEFLSMVLFLFITLSTVYTNCSDFDLSVKATPASPATCVLTQPRVLTIAFAFGVSIFVLVYAAASFSGGHLNPAVTIGLALGKRLSIVRAVLYILAQMAGATLGAEFAKLVNTKGYELSGGAANSVGAGSNIAASWLAEFLLTAALVYVVYAATDANRGTTTAHIPVLAPLAIGLTVFLAHIVAIPVDNCSINPARSFGASLVSGNWQDHWLFWVGPISGGIFAALVYELLLDFEFDADETPDAKPADDISYKTAPVGEQQPVLLPAYPGAEGLGDNEV